MGAADLNVVTLIGRLTRDMELKYISTGTAVGSFAIAVNRRRKSGDQWIEEASFFDCTLWGKAAEALQQYLTKGKKVGIDGELVQERWEQDGQNRSRVKIIVHNVQLLSFDNDNSQGGKTLAQPDKNYDDDIPF